MVHCCWFLVETWRWIFLIDFFGFFDCKSSFCHHSAKKASPYGTWFIICGIRTYLYNYSYLANHAETHNYLDDIIHVSPICMVIIVDVVIRTMLLLLVLLLLYNLGLFLILELETFFLKQYCIRDENKLCW